MVIIRAWLSDDASLTRVRARAQLPGLQFNDAVKTHFVWNAAELTSLDFSQKGWEDTNHAVVNQPNKRQRTR